MSKLNYMVKEFTPNQAQAAKGIPHSWYAQDVITNTLTNEEISQKIEARTGSRRYEIKSNIEALMEVTLEEVLEGNRIHLADSTGNVWLSISPDCKGGVSDDEILKKTTEEHAIDPSVAIRSVAQESDVTPDVLSWSINVSVGRNFLKKFNFEKKIQKVKPSSIYVEVPESTNTGGNDNNGGGGSDQDENVLG